MTDDHTVHRVSAGQTPHGDGYEGAPTYSGRCHGGPWDASDAEVRYAKGFLLIDKPEREVWIYDRRDDGDFYVRGSKPSALDDAKRLIAADSPDWDVRVLDPVTVEPAAEVAG